MIVKTRTRASIRLPNFWQFRVLLCPPARIENDHVPATSSNVQLAGVSAEMRVKILNMVNNKKFTDFMTEVVCKQNHVTKVMSPIR